MSADADGILSGQRLVIFGCGYVGAEVARQAVARGLTVTALTRNEATAEALRRAGIVTVVAELGGSDWHERIEGGATFGLDCVSAGGGGRDDYERSYLQGTASIVAWARARGAIGTLVYTGSTSVYPQGNGEVVNETSPTARTDEHAGILLETEDLVAGAPRGPQPAARRWFVLRLAGIYGPGRSHLLEQVRTGEIAGSGGHRLNLAHRDDIVAAIWAAFGAPSAIANEIFNVADDGPAPKAEVAEWLAERFGLPVPRFTGEAVPGRRRFTPDRVISNEKIKRMLGWRPGHATFREGFCFAKT